MVIIYESFNLYLDIFILIFIYIIIREILIYDFKC